MFVFKVTLEKVATNNINDNNLAYKDENMNKNKNRSKNKKKKNYIYILKEKS